MGKICQKCSASNPTNAKYCRRCGERFKDWKDPNPKPKVVYKNRIVKVDRTPTWVYITMSVLAILLGIMGWYTYKLEDENYSGEKYISRVIGEPEYLKVNGQDSVSPLVFVANDLGQTLNVSSNVDYHIEKMPSWCLIQDSTATGFRIKPYTNKGHLRYDTCFLVTDGQCRIALPIYQKGRCDATINSVRANTAATEEGQSGIAFTFRISTDNMKDNPGLCSIYFSDKDYHPVITGDSIYSAPDGQLCVSRAIRPKYSNSVFNSFRMFLPYSAIPQQYLQGKMLFHIVLWDNSFGQYLPLTDTGYYSLRLNN